MTLEISNVSAGYGNRIVLDCVSVADIRAGTLVGIIGPNASGKSTLLKTLAGLVKPSAGEMRLHGDDITHLPLKLRTRRVGYMPQAFGSNALLSVFESVLLALKQTNGWRVQSADLHAVESTLSALGLGHLSDRGISDLSGGQAQMVAVAQTLVRGPEVILLDEPTSALDLHNQLSILSSVCREMHLRKPVVIAALHDLNLAAKFCNRLVLIQGGKILADGMPENILALQELEEAYRVKIDLERTSKGNLFIDALLPARHAIGMRQPCRPTSN